MARVFISHAGQDIEMATEIKRWLVEDGHEVFIDRGPAGDLNVGDEWRPRLHERMRWCDAVVCVMTTAYVDSKWCWGEILLAQNRGCLILPVVAEDGVVHPDLRSIHRTDMSQDSAEVQRSLATALARIDVLGGVGWDDERSPFPGLRAFKSDRRSVFFGRSHEINQLVEKLGSPAERTGGGSLLVVGPSGCGKSSLVQAGLMPVIGNEPGWQTVGPFVPGVDPVGALARELAATSDGLRLGWTVEGVRGRLGESGIVALADELLEAAPKAKAGRLLLVVDQLEEIFTETEPSNRAQFTDLLQQVPAGPIQVVATLRSDFLGRVKAASEWARAAEEYRVHPLRREALRSVIERPAAVAGYRIDDELVDRLVDDTADDTALPLLAFTLDKLTKRKNGESRELSAARYDELGGVHGALTLHADAALDEAMKASDRSRDDVLDSLLHLVTVDDQGSPVGRRVDRGELPDLVDADLEEFVAQRLLVTGESDGSKVIGVAHEAFLTSWPPLVHAVDSAAPALRTRRAVEQGAEEWQRSGRPNERLWERGRLASALADVGARLGSADPDDATASPRGLRAPRLSRRWKRTVLTDRVQLNPTARTFLLRSIRWDRLRRGRLAAGLSILTILALVAAGIAIDRGNSLQDQLDIANAELLAQASLTRSATDPVTSTQLALAAWQLDPKSPSARAALLRQYVAMRSVESVVPDVAEQPLIAFGLSSDGRTLIQSEASGIVVVTGLPEGPIQRRVLPGSPSLTGSLANAATDRFVAAIDTAGAVLVWDLATGEGPRTISGPKPTVSDSVPFQFSGDEHLVWLEPAPSGAELRIWNVVTNTPVPHGLGPIEEPDVGAVGLSADATRVLIGLSRPGSRYADGPIIMRSLADGALLGTLSEETAIVEHGAAVCTEPGPDTAVAVITGPDLATPVRQIPLDGEFSCPLDFRRMKTRDGRHLADQINGVGDSTYADVIRIWDVTDGSTYEVSLPHDPNTESGVRWTVAEKMTVLPGPGSKRTVLVPHDRSVLRLIAEPTPQFNDTLDNSGQSDDASTIVAETNNDGYAAFDRASGRLLAQFDDEAVDTWLQALSVDDRLTLLRSTESGQEVAEYSLPVLEPVVRLKLPARPEWEPGPRVGIDLLPDRIFTLAEGLLTGWNRTTGAQLGPPVDLDPARTPESWEWYRGVAELDARPGHPGEVAVLRRPNIIEIWNVERGTHVMTVPQVAGGVSHGFAFDGAGSHLANVTNTGTLEVWDIDRGELVAAPIPIENTHRPVGFTADGTVITVGEDLSSSYLEVLTFWDVAAGRAVGTVQAALVDENRGIVDGAYLDIDGGALPHRLELTPQAWADTLCRFSQRPFTDIERAAFPEGSSIRPPC